MQQLLPHFPRYSSVYHLQRRYWVEDESLLGFKTVKQLRDA